MKDFFEKIRKPRTDISTKRKIAETVGILVFGLALGGNLDFAGGRDFNLCRVSLASCYQHILIFYQYVGGGLYLLQLRFRISAGNLYDDLGRDCFSFVLPSIHMLVRKRKRRDNLWHIYDVLQTLSSPILRRRDPIQPFKHLHKIVIIRIPHMSGDFLNLQRCSPEERGCFFASFFREVLSEGMSGFFFELSGKAGFGHAAFL